MNKFAVKLSSFMITFATMFVVAVPAFAAEPAIDFANETVKGLESTQEYSLDNKTWRPVYDVNKSSVIDLKPLIKTTGTTSIYYRKANDPEAETSTLVIPARPAAPKGLKFVGKEKTAEDLINTTDLHDVKYDYSLWVTSDSDGTKVGIFEKAGAKLQVRLGATDTAFTSLPATVAVPMMRVAPATAKYDTATDGVVVAKGMEYQIGTRPMSGSASALKDDDWITVGNTQNRVTRAEVNEKVRTLGALEGAPAYVYVRLKNTTTLGVSDKASVKFPAAIAAPTTPVLNITDEKLKTVSTTMEFRVLTDKTALTKNYTTPAWTAIKGTDQVITSYISGATAKTPNTSIEVRLKAVKGSGSVLDKPASAPIEFKMFKRPATPKASDFTIDYDPTVLKMIVPATHQWMYSTDAKWTDGGTDVNIKNKIPARGAKPVSVYVRVKPIEVNGTDIDTPASMPFKDKKINPTPAAPKSPTFNKASKKITGVTTKMEYVIGTGTAWESVVGTSISLTDKDPGTSGSVKVRLKSTANAPISEEKVVTYTIPAK